MNKFLRSRLSGAILATTFAALTAHAYVLMDPPYWPDGTVTLVTKLGTSPLYTDGLTPNAVAHSAAIAWNPYMVRVQLATSAGSAGKGGQDNGANEVFFSDTVYGYAFDGDVLAVTLVDGNASARTEADVIVNTAIHWNAYSGSFNGYSYDLRRVLVHEFGHVLGLEHPDEHSQGVSAIMNSYIGDIENPTDDDQDGVAFLYGDGRLPPPAPPAIIVQPQSYGVDLGAYVTTSVQASGTDPLTYQWFKDGNAIPGVTDNVYSVEAMTDADAGSYYVVVTNPWGKATSATAVWTVNPPVAPSFSNPPSSWVMAVHVGNTISIGGQNAFGTAPITYQWFRNGVPIAGATEQSLQIAGATTADAGSYSVVASNVAGSAVWNALTVIFEPYSAPPQATPFTSGDGVLQSGVATGDGSTFQWYRNGQPIAGATQSTYELPTTGPDTAADYVVAIGNVGGTTVSRTVHVGPAFSTGSPWTPVAPTGLDYVPSQIVLGTDGVVYLLSPVQGNIFSWSPDQAGYLGSLPLSGSANAIAYDPGTAMLHAGYADHRITTVDPTGSVGEAAFVTAADSVQALAMTGNALFVSTAPGNTTSASFSTYNRNGQLVGFFANGQLSEVEWNAPLQRVYYFQYYGGNPLWTALIAGVVNTDGTLGAFGGGPQIQVRYPICIPPKVGPVLTGTGAFYDPLSLAPAGSLPVQIDAAAWLDGRLYTMRNTSDGSRIERWTSNLAVDASGTVPGYPLRLFALSDHRLLAIAERSSAPDFTIVDAALDNITAAPPEIVIPPESAAVAAGNSAALAVNASTGGSSYQWTQDGNLLVSVTSSAFGIDNFASSNSGIYQATLTVGHGTSQTVPSILGLAATAKVTGSASEIGPNIRHPNGNYYDQVLLQGSAASVTADAGQVTRTSYIDRNGDIVQVEFAGAGTLSLVLGDYSGPATPENYSQPSVTYMKGDAGIVITGADETTNVSVFTVGRATAFDPTGAYDITKPISATNVPANNGSSLFQGHSGTAYDGIADVRYIAILSRNGYFGGLRASNARFDASAGLTGIYAPGVQFVGPVYVGNIDAHDAATPVLVLGSASDTRITGGDLAQTNAQAVEVSGVSQLKFTAGTNSAGTLLPAQHNQAVLEQDGNDVTDLIVVNPTP